MSTHLALSPKAKKYIEGLKRWKENRKIEEKTGEVKATLEFQAAVLGTAYMMGRIETKTGKHLELFGVPIEIMLGGALVVTAMADLAGKYDEDLLNLGNGMAAAGLARLGYSYGASAAKEGRFLGVAGSPRFGYGTMPRSNMADSALADALRSV